MENIMTLCFNIRTTQTELEDITSVDGNEIPIPVTVPQSNQVGEDEIQISKIKDDKIHLPQLQ